MWSSVAMLFRDRKLLTTKQVWRCIVMSQLPIGCNAWPHSIDPSLQSFKHLYVKSTRNPHPFNWFLRHWYTKTTIRTAKKFVGNYSTVRLKSSLPPQSNPLGTCTMRRTVASEKNRSHSILYELYAIQINSVDILANAF